MISCGPSIELRPATPEDRFRIRRWLTDPEQQVRWGNAASAEAEINLAAASESALCRIVMCGGESVGYAHAFDYSLLGDGQSADLPPGTWYLNLLLTAEQRARELEPMALALITGEVFATTLAVACAGLVSIRSETVARTYERAGFRWKQVLHDRMLGPSWLMVMERPG